MLVQDQIGIIDAELLGIPVLDQAVEHVEIVRKIDDAGRVAVRKSNGHSAGEGAWRRNERFLFHRDGSCGASSPVYQAGRLTGYENRRRVMASSRGSP